MKEDDLIIKFRGLNGIKLLILEESEERSDSEEALD